MELVLCWKQDRMQQPSQPPLANPTRAHTASPPPPSRSQPKYRFAELYKWSQDGFWKAAQPCLLSCSPLSQCCSFPGPNMWGAGLLVAKPGRGWCSARKLGCCGQEDMVPGGVQHSRPGNWELCLNPTSLQASSFHTGFSGVWKFNLKMDIQVITSFFFLGVMMEHLYI